MKPKELDKVIQLLIICLYYKQSMKLFKCKRWKVLFFICVLCKGFDSVQRNTLRSLLYSLGLSCKMCQLPCTIYENVKVCVRSSRELTEMFDSKLGRRQGHILSPFLFSFFINELETQNGMHNAVVFSINCGWYYIILMYFWRF